MSDIKDTFGGIGRAWANPKAKKGIILTLGLVAMFGAVAALSLNRERANTVPAAAKAPQVPYGASRDALGNNAPPIYKDLVREADRQRAEEAAKGVQKTVLPNAAGLADSNKRPIEAGESGVVPVKLPPLATDRTQRQVAQPLPSQSSAPPIAPAKSAVDRSGQQNAAALLNKWLQKTEQNSQTSSWSPIGASTVRGGIDPTKAPQVATLAQPGAGQQVAPQGASQVNDVQAARALVARARPVVSAGETFFATIDTAINTDYPGPVVATIHHGKLAGARLIGQKSLEFDAVSIRFTRLAPADGGPMMPANAFAILIDDAKTFGLTGIKGETDYHVMQRYVLPSIFAFAQTYGAVTAMPRSTIGMGSGSTVHQTERLSSGDRTVVALGGALGPIQRDLQRYAQRPITIALPANTEVGVMFATDVLDRQTQQAMNVAGIPQQGEFESRPAPTAPQLQLPAAGRSGSQGTVISPPIYAPGAYDRSATTGATGAMGAPVDASNIVRVNPALGYSAPVYGGQVPAPMNYQR